VRDGYIAAAENAFNSYRSFLQKSVDELSNVNKALLTFINDSQVCVAKVEAFCAELGDPRAIAACEAAIALITPDCINAAADLLFDPNGDLDKSVVAIATAAGDAAAAVASYGAAVVDVSAAGLANAPIAAACPSLRAAALTDLGNSIKGAVNDLVSEFNPLLQNVNNDMATASQLMRVLGGYGFTVP